MLAASLEVAPPGLSLIIFHREFLAAALAAVTVFARDANCSLHRKGLDVRGMRGQPNPTDRKIGASVRLRAIKVPPREQTIAELSDT